MSELTEDQQDLLRSLVNSHRRNPLPRNRVTEAVTFYFGRNTEDKQVDAALVEALAAAGYLEIWVGKKKHTRYVNGTGKVQAYLTAKALTSGSRL